MARVSQPHLRAATVTSQHKPAHDPGTLRRTRTRSTVAGLVESRLTAGAGLFGSVSWQHHFGGRIHRV